MRRPFEPVKFEYPYTASEAFWCDDLGPGTPYYKYKPLMQRVMKEMRLWDLLEN